MSFKATLDIGDKTFDLLYCASVLEQQTDETGRPASGVRGGILSLVIKGTDDDSLAAWAVDTAKQQDGTITFFRIDQDAKFKKIEFKNAWVASLAESFIADDDLQTMGAGIPDADQQYRLIMQVQGRTRSSYITFCSLSCGKISIDGVDHDNKW